MPLPGIVMVFGIWIDILAKVKFSNLRKKNKNIFVFENISFLFLFSFFLFVDCVLHFFLFFIFMEGAEHNV